ncbi:MAG: adenosylcobinamide-phosphate synthase CbiB [Hydrogenophilus sp.]|nr:adenosylcobinamide-phosphate synthase CbiB [Hydrogenophilus sp.]
MASLLSLLLGILWDRVIGEPKRGHPLILFGRYATFLERLLHSSSASPHRQRLNGALAWFLATAPLLSLYFLILWNFPALLPLVDALILGVALGWRSLEEHVQAVVLSLTASDLPTARAAVSRIVSRDAHLLDAEGIAVAATESALENGHDAVIATLFWFALAGGAGALLHRLVNTLDAMWGYRTPRYQYFGTFAARADDLLGFPSARLTALLYTLLGPHPYLAFTCWRQQASRWPSPNAGPVLAAGAGALAYSLGGPAPYEGRWQERPLLGHGPKPTPTAPLAALSLIDRAAFATLLLALLWILLTRS